METRASKTASDSSPTQNPPQNVQGPFTTVKLEPTSDISNPEIRLLHLSDEELSVVMAMRSPPSASNTTTPSCSKINEDFQKPLQVSFPKMEHLTPPYPNPPTAVTASSTSTTTKTEKYAPKHLTPKWDLSDLARNQFTLSSTLNKPRWDRLNRILKSNGLYTLAINERVPPRPTLDNITGYTDATTDLCGPPSRRCASLHS